MLWSLIKILFFVVAIIALAFGVNYLTSMSGGVQIAFGNTEYTLGPLQSIVALILLVLTLYLILKLFGFVLAFVRFLNGDETAISRYFSANRERKGYQALADGLMALASGEGRVALSQADRARRLLNKPELTNLISAQAAEMEGDKKKAKDIYVELLKDDRTRFVGVRGIMKQKLAEGDTETAKKLAEKAFDLKPKHNETGDVLLQLQAENEDWAGARKTLNTKVSNGVLPRDVHKRRDAVLALSEARDIFANAGAVEAQVAAIEANRLSPDLIPAAVMAAKAYMEQEKPRYATRVLVAAWKSQPHPDLAAGFADIVPTETTKARIKRFAGLIKSDSEHPEARLLMAELHIADEDFAGARKALGGLNEDHPTSRSLTIMAAIERGEGSDDAIVRGWLTKALGASRGPQWTCDKCNHVHSSWTAICDRCSGFDTLAWKTPAEGAIAMHGSSQMLPLIVGQEKVVEPEQEVVDAEEVITGEIVSDDVKP